MRAIFVENLKDLEDECTLDGEKFHHLAKVLRVKVNDEILFLDGNGSSRKSIVTIISKKTIECRFTQKCETTTKNSALSVALGKTKRDALELSLKQLVEIGIETIYIFNSEYSQRIEFKEERLHKLLQAALEQSNAKFIPKISFIDFEDLFKIEMENIIYFSSFRSERSDIDPKQRKNLVIIGPEGGLSNEEESRLANLENCQTIKLPTNLMRAPTATSFCLGYCLGKLNKLD